VNAKRSQTAAELDKSVQAEHFPHVSNAKKRGAFIYGVSFHILNSEKEIDVSRPAWTISRTHYQHTDSYVGFTFSELRACKKTVCTEVCT
jgi:hypothetical protein